MEGAENQNGTKAAVPNEGLDMSSKTEILSRKGSRRSKTEISGSKTSTLQKTVTHSENRMEGGDDQNSNNAGLNNLSKTEIENRRASRANKAETDRKGSRVNETETESRRASRASKAETESRRASRASKAETESRRVSRANDTQNRIVSGASKTETENGRVSAANEAETESRRGSQADKNGIRRSKTLVLQKQTSKEDTKKGTDSSRRSETNLSTSMPASSEIIKTDKLEPITTRDFGTNVTMCAIRKKSSKSAKKKHNWGNLAPYFDTSALNSCKAEPTMISYQYRSRSTTYKILDPEVSLKMDQLISPELPYRSVPQICLSSRNRKSRAKTQSKKRCSPKEKKDQKLRCACLRPREDTHGLDEIAKQHYWETRHAFFRMGLDQLINHRPGLQALFKSLILIYMGTTKGSLKAVKQLTNCYCN
ncbi:uncharacterized protein LOC103176170 [Callorhinchus milii]|uniref:uncharacterized protein LOC103176170 n=1 Tax=Callorhinchus milii TaxID=7868 RepID=UPI00045731E6|nr:uncharacterized protein LOC103176170 [Callorhinchus milii]|eukprot:gi/632944928/ref/XP_007887768.1/ PREDICTED: mucin-22-like [Callorhinchus milii]